ncbi:MAG: oxidoreductase [Candidatus Parcubacteria bacterium]|nr:oxidoreductase [Burkholderiales bacterium]
MKWNLIFDVDKCTGCQNCTLAVQDEYIGNSFPGYAAEMPRHGKRWVEIERRDRGSHPIVDVAYAFHACQHCDDAPCVAAAKDGAAYKRPDGIVVIDPVKSKGQKQIAAACPYGAVSWNEALSIPQHWNFDAHLIDRGWTAPRPAQACPTGALRALKVSDDEMVRIAREEGLEPLRPELNLRPRVHYRNLKRVRSEMLGGALVGEIAGRDECVAGANVRLYRDEALLQETRSDVFGEFRFDGLSAGGFRLEVDMPVFQKKIIEHRLETSANLGDIRLKGVN